MKIGFVNYDDPVVSPTTQELLATLTSPQKLGILNSFADGVCESDVKHIYNIRLDVVIYFYIKINSIERTASDIMNDVNPPTNNVELATAVQIQDNDFNITQVQLIVNKMIQYSKEDGDGDWTYYSTKVVI